MDADGEKWFKTTKLTPGPSSHLGLSYFTAAVHLPWPQKQQWLFRDRTGSCKGITAFAFGKLSTSWEGAQLPTESNNSDFLFSKL